MGRVAMLPCVACDEYPAEVHHVKPDLAAPRIHFMTMPLCSVCHRTGGPGVAIETDLDLFEEAHGKSQLEMLGETFIAVCHIEMRELVK